MDTLQICICSNIVDHMEYSCGQLIFLSNNVIMSIYYNNEIKVLYVPTT